jgi:hypothetical protein
MYRGIQAGGYSNPISIVENVNENDIPHVRSVKINENDIPHVRSVKIDVNFN